MSTIAGDNVTYTSSQIVGANGNQIERNALTANSTDVFPTTAALALSEWGITLPDTSFDNSSFIIGIANATGNGFNISQLLGAGQTFVPTTTFFGPTNLSGGTGYANANDVATTGGTGTGLTVNITQTGGVIDNVIIADQGSGYTDGDTITVTGGGADATFDLSLSDSILDGQTVVYEFVLTDGSTATGAMDVFIRSKGSSGDSTGILLPDGQILVGDTSGQASAVVMSGDGTMDNTGAFTLGPTVSSGPIVFTNTIETEQGLILEDPGGGANTTTLQAGTVGTSYTITLPDNVGSTGQILQTTNGTGTLAWVNNVAGSLGYYYADGPVAAATVTGTAATVDMDQNEIQSGSFSNTNGVITVPSTGTYKISYTLQFQSLDQTGGLRAAFASQVLIGNGVGVIAASVTECYMREQSSSLIRPSVSRVILYTVTNVAETIAIQALRTIGTTTGEVRPDECTITIEQLV